MYYATYEDIEKSIGRKFTEDEIEICEFLIERAAVRIDAYNADADESAKREVTISMVQRVAASMGDVSMPIGATQGSISALSYSQSWTMSNGAIGELYLSKSDKKLLGVGNKIGSYSLLENLQ